MPTRIQVKRGTTDPTGLTTGEFGFNTTNSTLFIGNTAAQRWIGGEITGGVDMGAGSAASQNRVPTQNSVYQYARNNFVHRLNGITGGITLNAGANITITSSVGGGITIASSDTVGVTAGDAVTWTQLQRFPAGISAHGATLSGTVTAPTQAIGTNNTTVATTAFVQSEIVADTVTSIDGVTGAITNVARTNAGNTFSVVQVFNAGISAAGGITLNGPVTGATATFSRRVTANGGVLTSNVNNCQITRDTSTNSIGLGNGVSTGRGDYNIGIGITPLNGNYDGSKNIGIGYQALFVNYNGNENIGIGFESLLQNINGSANIAIGMRSLYGNTGGSGNIAIGNYALYNTVSDGSIALGTSALQNYSDVGENIAIGNEAMSFSTSGSINIALGSGALSSNSGSTNIGIGTLTLEQNTADNNIGIGFRSLRYNTTGARNIGIGVQTLVINDSGVGNVAIGDNSLAGNFDGSDNIAIGDGALSASNGAENVGIGSQCLQNNTGTGNVGVGFQALNLMSSGVSNTAVGHGSLASADSAEENVGIGSSSLIAITGNQNTAIGFMSGAYEGTGSNFLTSATGGIYIGSYSRGSTNGQTNEIVIGRNAVGLGSNTAVIGATTQTAATIYGRLNLPDGLSAAGGITLNGSLTGTTATFSGTVESNAGFRIGAGAINARTSGYTLTAGDNGKVVTFNSGTAMVCGVDTAAGATGFSCTVIQLGTGGVRFASSGVTLNSYAGLTLAGQHAAASLVCYQTNVFNVAGNLTT